MTKNLCTIFDGQEFQIQSNKWRNIIVQISLREGNKENGFYFSPKQNKFQMIILSY